MGRGRSLTLQKSWTYFIGPTLNWNALREDASNEGQRYNPIRVASQSSERNLFFLQFGHAYYNINHNLKRQTIRREGGTESDGPRIVFFEVSPVGSRHRRMRKYSSFGMRWQLWKRTSLPWGAGFMTLCGKTTSAEAGNGVSRERRRIILRRGDNIRRRRGSFEARSARQKDREA